MVLAVISYLGHVKPLYDDDADAGDDDDDDEIWKWRKYQLVDTHSE